MSCEAPTTKARIIHSASAACEPATDSSTLICQEFAHMLQAKHNKTYASCVMGGVSGSMHRRNRAIRFRRSLPVVLASFTAILAVMAFAPGDAQARVKSFALADYATGYILSSANLDVRLHPASLTKLMTLYLVYEAIRDKKLSLDEKVKISKRAAQVAPSRLGLRAGQRVLVRHLIAAAAVKSANDAAIALAEAVAGSEARFARLMTRKAQLLGMTRTTFKNATGFTSQGHLSTARDMVTLGRRLISDFPEHYSTFERRQIRWGGRNLAATNSRFLKGYKGADGIKTGYTRAAGYTIVASAVRNNHRLLMSYFGADSSSRRTTRISQILDEGFKLVKNGGLLLASTASPQPPPRPVAVAASDQPVLLATPKDSEAPPVRLAAGTQGTMNWAVQVGAFRGESRAELHLARITRDHGSALGSSRPRVLRQRKLYIARFDGFDENSARQACERLRNRRVECLPLRYKLEDQVPRATVQPAVLKSDEGDWVLQVGAYGRASRARTRLDELRKSDIAWLQDRSFRVPKSGKYYLAQFLDFDEASARAACVELKKRRIDCLPLVTRAKAKPSNQSAADWVIQVGAFRNSSNAHRELRRLRSAKIAEVEGKRALIPKRGRRFVVHLTGYDRDSAFGACEAVRKKGFQCLTVAPSQRNSTGTVQARRTDWAIQVGAYAKSSQARAQLKRIEKQAVGELASARPWVPKQGRYFLAQFRDLNKNSATAACDTLNSRGVECLSLAPQRN